MDTRVVKPELLPAMNLQRASPRHANHCVIHCHADQVQRKACSHSHAMQPVLPDMTLKPPDDLQSLLEGGGRAFTGFNFQEEM